MFLVRIAFWLTLVIAFIPVNAEDLRDGQRAVSTGETLLAAQALVADLAGFCERNPATCGTGRELFSQLGAKAKTGARYLYRYMEDGELANADAISTGSIALPAAAER